MIELTMNNLLNVMLLELIIIANSYLIAKTATIGFLKAKEVYQKTKEISNGKEQ